MSRAMINLVLTDKSTLYLILVAGRVTPGISINEPTISVEDASGASPVVKSSVNWLSLVAGSNPGNYERDIDSDSIFN